MQNALGLARHSALGVCADWIGTWGRPQPIPSRCRLPQGNEILRAPIGLDSVKSTSMPSSQAVVTPKAIVLRRTAFVTRDAVDRPVFPKDRHGELSRSPEEMAEPEG